MKSKQIYPNTCDICEVKIINQDVEIWPWTIRGHLWLLFLRYQVQELTKCDEFFGDGSIRNPSVNFTEKREESGKN